MTHSRPAADHVLIDRAARRAVSYGQYARCFPLWSTVGMALLAVGMVFLYRGTSIGMAVLSAGGACLATDWFRFRRRVARSRLCPAQVVSESSYFVAVWCDLSPRETARAPAIVVLEQPLQRMTGGAPATGARLAAMVAFGGDPHAECWSEVSAMVVNCCMQDRTAIHELLATISDEQWQRLEGGLLQLSQLTKPGLYRVANVDAVAVAGIEAFEVEPQVNSGGVDKCPDEGHGG